MFDRFDIPQDARHYMTAIVNSRVLDAAEIAVVAVNVVLSGDTSPVAWRTALTRYAVECAHAQRFDSPEHRERIAALYDATDKYAAIAY